ncbi:lytic transglycosylase domain-containing protein [Paraburkholderia sp. Tr-20389]|uniref:lytic transglycosylase domain-containing protein n=1 Tax=Paraburkholderia sp. Tr-20389 TaxID=2703903 RepID=UPI001980CE9C|nr:lytic transglycosylase domain-containing protein [Paraburkholderia sp. Tr-20389]MBN3752686.1 lytic transglycosylase domain-containing protein [Paraburkholderia sp. Tr-20389]
MRRLVCLTVLAFSVMQSAWADDQTNHDRTSDYLHQKFGVAKEKAEQISNAVRVASEKYALPPALILAIISIESRFKEKAKGGNGATGLMQVVPGAHKRMLKDVKDLTDPETNIEIGSAILYGYVKSSGGDLNAALKSYGGSQAYAEKVNGRVKTFADVVSVEASAVPGADQPLPSRDGGCDARYTSLCIGPVIYASPEADAASSASVTQRATNLLNSLLPLSH